MRRVVRRGRGWPANAMPTARYSVLSSRRSLPFRPQIPQSKEQQMLRGAIDYATPSRLGGWVFSEAVSLRDHTVLAYLGEVCIGTGQIDKFRQDLADAGLSDGFLGFNFAIALDRPADLARVVIRLDGSAGGSGSDRHAAADPPPRFGEMDARAR